MRMFKAGCCAVLFGMAFVSAACGSPTEVFREYAESQIGEIERISEEAGTTIQPAYRKLFAAARAGDWPAVKKVWGFAGKSDCSATAQRGALDRAPKCNRNVFLESSFWLCRVGIL